MIKDLHIVKSKYEEEEEDDDDDEEKVVNIFSVFKQFEEEKRVQVSCFFSKLMNNQIAFHQITDFVTKNDKLISFFFLLSLKKMKLSLPKFILFTIYSYFFHSFLWTTKEDFRNGAEYLKSFL